MVARQVATASPKITPGRRVRAISAAMIVPLPKALVRINTSPGCAPALVIGRSARPVTVKPMVSSAPVEEWPPTISAPAWAKTFAASSMISASVRVPKVSDRRGRMTWASAACGFAPMAKMSPSA